MLSTFALSNKDRNKLLIIIMKALIIIAACILFPLALKAVLYFTKSRPINSVGGKANTYSTQMAKFDLNDPEDVKKAMEVYKDIAD